MEITSQRLNQGLTLLRITASCPNSHNCLWLARPCLFIGAMPRNCPREDCGVIIFRKMFEDKSPAFYHETLKLSQFDDIAMAALRVFSKRKGRKRRARRLAIRATDLHTFGQLLVLSLYPLSLEARGVPFLNIKEIAAFRNNYREIEMHRTLKQMEKINADWFSRITSIMGNLISPHENYPFLTTYFVYLFLKGMEKDQWPDLRNMPEKEKNEFFQELFFNNGKRTE